MRAVGVLFFSLASTFGVGALDSGITSRDALPVMHDEVRRRPRATWPVAGVPEGRELDTVVEPFVRPACRWCPGRRGVWIEVSAVTSHIKPVSGVAVLAPWQGTVTFAGLVVDRLHVTVRLPGGALLTCGGLLTIDPAIVAGSPVEAGQVLGSAADRLFLSVRRSGVHVEPLTALGFARPRLTVGSAVGSPWGSR